MDESIDHIFRALETLYDKEFISLVRGMLQDSLKISRLNSSLNLLFTEELNALLAYIHSNRDSWSDYDSHFYKPEKNGLSQSELYESTLRLDHIQAIRLFNEIFPDDFWEAYSDPKKLICLATADKISQLSRYTTICFSINPSEDNRASPFNFYIFMSLLCIVSIQNANLSLKKVTIQIDQSLIQSIEEQNSLDLLAYYLSIQVFVFLNAESIREIGLSLVNEPTFTEPFTYVLFDELERKDFYACLGNPSSIVDFLKPIFSLNCTYYSIKYFLDFTISPSVIDLLLVLLKRLNIKKVDIRINSLEKNQARYLIAMTDLTMRLSDEPRGSQEKVDKRDILVNLDLLCFDSKSNSLENLSIEVASRNQDSKFTVLHTKGLSDLNNLKSLAIRYDRIQSSILNISNLDSLLATTTRLKILSLSKIEMSQFNCLMEVAPDLTSIEHIDLAVGTGSEYASESRIFDFITLLLRPEYRLKHFKLDISSLNDIVNVKLAVYYIENMLLKPFLRFFALVSNTTNEMAYSLKLPHFESNQFFIEMEVSKDKQLIQLSERGNPNAFYRRWSNFEAFIFTMLSQSTSKSLGKIKNRKHIVKTIFEFVNTKERKVIYVEKANKPIKDGMKFLPVENISTVLYN